MKRTLLAVGLASLLLVACGGDDEGLLNPPTDTSSLVAAPLTLKMKADETRTVDLSDSVTAVDIASWSLSGVDDADGLGRIDNLKTHTFDYEALTAGVTALRYTVQGGNKTASSEVLVAVQGAIVGDNTSPAALNVTGTTKSNKNIGFDLTDYISDADGDALSIGHVVSSSGRFTATESGIVTFKPDGFVGVDSAAYSVEDGQGGYGIAYIVVTSEDANPVKPNTPPKAKDITANINTVLTPVWTIDLAKNNIKDTISDADGDPLTIVEIFSGNKRTTFKGTTITYTPGDFTGIDQFTYVISDGRGGFATGTVTLTVSNGTDNSNQIPTAEPRTLSNVDGNDTRPVIIDLSESVDDKDGDALKLVSVIGANGNARLIADSPLEVSYTIPSPLQGLKDNFAYVVTDGKGGYAMSTVTIEMVASNPNAPEAKIAQMKTAFTTPLNINLANFISDAETSTNALTISNLQINTPPSDHKATATLAGQVVTYNPNGFIGVDVLTYTVSDGKHQTEGVITVTAYDPDAADEHVFTAGHVELLLNLGAGEIMGKLDWVPELSNATPADIASASVVGARLGTVTVNPTTNALNYTATAGKYGTDQFIYTLTDKHTPAHLATGLVTVELIPPAPPEITSLSIDGAPIIGSTLTANVTCERCDDTKYQYKWVVNGLLTGTDKTYMYRTEDKGFYVRLEVTGEDGYGQKTAEYGVYERIVVEDIYSTDSAFAAIKNDGSVVTWGTPERGGDSTGVDFSGGFERVFSNKTTFFAIKNDGSVVTWGLSDSSAVDFSGGIKTLVSTHYAFAAIKNDGSVVTWGGSDSGGDSTGVDFSGGVKTIFPGQGAFAAIKNDGSVVTWGPPERGGDSTGVDFSGGVKTIFPGQNAFAAIKNDGSVVTWGELGSGSDSTGVDFSGGIKTIVSSRAAFAAIKNDDSVISWGDPRYGGDSTRVDFSGGVKTIIPSVRAFAAIKNDDSVVSWGDPNYAGNSTGVDFSGGVKAVLSTLYAYAAIKNDDSVVTWGARRDGGDSTGVDFSGGVKAVLSTLYAFAAIKNDDSVVSWGASRYGGDSTGVDFSGGVKAIHSSDAAFVAIKNDGSVVTWGRAASGGDSSAVAEDLAPSFSKIEGSIM